MSDVTHQPHDKLFKAVFSNVVTEFVDTVEQFATGRGKKIMTYAEELLREGELHG